METAMQGTVSTADRPTRRSAVSCRGVFRHFGTGEARVTALAGVNLEVPAGELTLLVGPSGCGKTTLISIIAALLDPSEGEVEVFSQSLTRMSGRRRAHFRAEQIGFVFQQYNLLPALTAAENAAVPLIIAGMPRAKAIEKAKATLSAVGLGEKVNALPRQLSGGQQQRVAIARALVHDPKMLVCDEPTAALDASSGRKVMELIREVAVQADRCVLVVTHDSRVYDFGDRIVSMADGRIESVEEKQRA
jgi:putative ABC transport system ATP-binding protein